MLAVLLCMPLASDWSMQDGRPDPTCPAIVVAKCPIEIRHLERPIHFPEGTSGFGLGPFGGLTDALNNELCDEGLHALLRSKGNKSLNGTIYIWIAHNNSTEPSGRSLKEAIKNLRDALPKGRKMVIFLTGFPKDVVPMLELLASMGDK
jgi:hypothetical protein